MILNSNAANQRRFAKTMVLCFNDSQVLDPNSALLVKFSGDLALVRTDIEILPYPRSSKRGNLSNNTKTIAKIKLQKFRAI